MSFAASNERYVPYQSIEVPSTNGLSYQPSNQSIIHLEIPDFINFIYPEQTYLKLDLQLAGAPALPKAPMIVKIFATNPTSLWVGEQQQRT